MKTFKVKREIILSLLLAPLICAAATSKTETRDLLAKAYELDAAGDHRSAIDVYEFALKSDTNDGNGWYFLGVAKVAAGDLQGAISAFGKSRKLGSGIEQAKAEQIFDEIVQMEAVIQSGLSMREGWRKILADALRVYRPATDRRYQVASETSQIHYYENPELTTRKDRKDFLGSCRGQRADEPDGTIMRVSFADVKTTPILVSAKASNSGTEAEYCSDGKHKTSGPSGVSKLVLIEIPGSFLVLGSDTPMSVEHPVEITGNPFSPGTEQQWSIVTKLKSGVLNSNTTRIYPDPSHIGLNSNLSGRILRLEKSEMNWGKPSQTSMTIFDDPSAPIAGVKSNFQLKNEMFSVKTLDEKIISRTGDLNSVGSVLVYVMESTSRTNNTNNDPAKMVRTTTTRTIKRIR